MKLSELMAGISPNPNFEGFVTNDDNVLAVDISPDHDAEYGDYAVVQMGVAGLDAQMNPVTQDKQYIRAGQSTTKTGTQRTFKPTGDRYIGDPFQDYAFSHAIRYGVGQSVVVPYVYFNVLNGKGEKGTVSIIVNSDGGGSAGESAAIDIDLRKVGAMPTEYEWNGGSVLGNIAVTSEEGGSSGETKITATPAVPSGQSAVYKTGSGLSLPALDDVLTDGWAAFTSGNDYTATTGHDFVVAYIDGENKAKSAGKTTVVAAE